MGKRYDDGEDEGIEIIYWGDEEDKSIVDNDRFKNRNTRKKKEESFSIWKEIFSLVRLVVFAVIIAVVINNFIIINAEVPSGSMEPTIHEKSRMIGFRLSYVSSEPKRGDIIIFKYPDDEKQNFVKRVIGLPGEYVEINDGVVYINDTPLTEDYVYFIGGRPDRKGDYAKTLVPDGCYFVLGDNRNDSKDSRFWSTTPFVKEDEILGKAVFSYYPSFYKLK